MKKIAKELLDLIKSIPEEELKSNPILKQQLLCKAKTLEKRIKAIRRLLKLSKEIEQSLKKLSMEKKRKYKKTE